MKKELPMQLSLYPGGPKCWLSHSEGLHVQGPSHDVHRPPMPGINSLLGLCSGAKQERWGNGPAAICKVSAGIKSSRITVRAAPAETCHSIRKGGG